MVSDALVEEVRARADLVEICGEYVSLKRVGKSYRGPCPLHGGEGPNFSIDADRGIYKCFVCGEGGDVFSFVMQHLGLDFPEAVRHVAERVGVEIPDERDRGPDPYAGLREVTAFAEEWFVARRRSEEGATARVYLAERGVDEATADRFAIGFAPEGWRGLRDAACERGIDEEVLLEVGLLATSERAADPYDRFRSRLMFSIRDLQDRPIGFGGRLLGPEEQEAPKYINSPDSPIFEKGRSLYLLNAARHAMRRSKAAVVVEGFMDAVTLNRHGFENVVAPLGTALARPQAALIGRYAPQAYLAYDSDTPGRKASFRAADTLLEAGVHPLIVTLPPGEDPDSLVRRLGREEFSALLEDAMDVLELKLRMLGERGYFDSAEGRRTALDHLLSTLRAVHDAALRDIYIGRAAEMTGVRRETIVHEVAREPKRVAPRPRPAQRPRRGSGKARGDAEAGAEKSLLLLLVRDALLTADVPDRAWICRALDDGVRTEHFQDPAYRALFGALSDRYRKGGGTDAAGLVEAVPSDLRGLVEGLLGDATELTHPEEIYEASVERLICRPAERRLREIRREMKMADEAQKKQLLREQLEIRAGLPESEKARLALVLDWLERPEPADLEEWRGNG
ncbi:MAG: DNA primase [Gemmatimonadales bacterium]